MSGPPIQRVAVIGTGVIGASWVACFLAHGLDVTVTDPRPGVETALRAAVAAQWPALQDTGRQDIEPQDTGPQITGPQITGQQDTGRQLTGRRNTGPQDIALPPGAPFDSLHFAASPEAAVAEAQFVQENAPERLDVKRDLFRQLDAAAPADAILATSSSTLMVSEFQDACARHPERVVLGHPFNPPHLMPLVEVAGGRATSEAAMERALGFYRALGKRPIRLRKEVRGHVANRLQAALWQEAFHLVSAGVADVADIDAAIADGPGLRWALLGPFANLHLSGGAGGIGELFDKPLWQATESLWRDLGEVTVDAALGRVVAEGVAQELGPRDMGAVLRQRDKALLALLKLKAEMAAGQ